MTFEYDPSWSATTRPGSDTNFFAIGGNLNYEDVQCAEMARVAYSSWDGADRLKFDAYLSRAGFSGAQTVDMHGSEAFVASSATTTVVSFRGTQLSDPFDLFTDSRFHKSDWSSGGQVHNGFRASIREIWPTVERAIEQSRGTRLLCTGHSLGGALATLAASLRPPDLLVTLASPRVGDQEFGRTLDGIEHHRYVNCADLVPRVPGEVIGYRHSGELRFIDAAGSIFVNPTHEFVELERQAAIALYREWCALVRGNVPSREIADHAPTKLRVGHPGHPRVVIRLASGVVVVDDDQVSVLGTIRRHCVRKWFVRRRCCLLHPAAAGTAPSLDESEAL